MFYLLNEKTIKREKEEGKKQEGREKRSKDLRGNRGGDVSGHEVSLVTTATDKRRAHPPITTVSNSIEDRDESREEGKYTEAPYGIRTALSR